MEALKQHLLEFISTHNQGRPVSYPALDRKMMQHYPDLVKAGKLGAVLDEMVAERIVEQVGPSTYQTEAPGSIA